MLLSSIFDVELEPHGYIGRANAYGVMGATSRPGVYVAGSATGPETIDDSIAQGTAAAMSALAQLHAGVATAAAE
jgi:heterodisulfide reductase subunit A